MKTGLLIALMTLGVGAILAITAGAVLTGESHAQARTVAGPQPDTSSPNWKEVSDDVGVMIRDDERLGLRGRLYVRVDGVWYPVAIDGPADVHPTAPVK